MVLKQQKLLYRYFTICQAKNEEISETEIKIHESCFFHICYVIIINHNGGICLSLRLFGEYTRKEASLLNALQLAYIGDVVWEVLVRETMIHQGLNLHHMHGTCVGYVNAHAQAGFLQKILSDLTEEEAEIVRRGRNAHAKHPAPRNQDPGDYAASTGYEALIGFLYLTGQDARLKEIANNMIIGEDHGREKEN